METKQAKPPTIHVRLKLEDAEAWLTGTDVPEIQDAIQAAVERGRFRVKVEAEAKAAIEEGKPLDFKGRRAILRRLREAGSKPVERIYRNWLYEQDAEEEGLTRNRSRKG